ncbi:methyltransferase domain-containing protein [Candidatus Fermentibacteria bacterium]|nr:methyltransferase domain-containing protein [Candidatus Fermentibacteria bacterium]
MSGTFAARETEELAWASWDAVNMPLENLGIRKLEEELRAWFTEGMAEPRSVVDGLDIGWGGVQRWATSAMPDLGRGLHLDFACGYATFLAQLGWRFPQAGLVGLNIDFSGVHAAAKPLLRRARVRARLVRGDARRIPFPDGAFESVSCFLGMQDIELAFGEQALFEVLGECVRVLRSSGILCLLDEIAFECFDALLASSPLEVETRAERALDVRWDREAAECAVELYAQGWLQQRRLRDPSVDGKMASAYLAKLRKDLEKQFADRGYYVPFGPVRMVVCRKLR